MLCESVMRTPAGGAYEQHKFLDTVMKGRMIDVPRAYTWMPLSDTEVRVRADTDEDDQWCPVQIPKAGAPIRFTFDAHVRRWCTGRDGRRFRVSNTRYMDNLDWLERKAPEAGLKLRAQDYDAIKVLINKPEPRPFVLTASRFRGMGILTDPKRFATVLATGVDSSAKAFGFGFLSYTVLEG